VIIRNCKETATVELYDKVFGFYIMEVTFIFSIMCHIRRSSWYRISQQFKHRNLLIILTVKDRPRSESHNSPLSCGKFSRHKIRLNQPRMRQLEPRLLATRNQPINILHFISSKYISASLCKTIKQYCKRSLMSSLQPRFETERNDVT